MCAFYITKILTGTRDKTRGRESREGREEQQGACACREGWLWEDREQIAYPQRKTWIGAGSGRKDSKARGTGPGLNPDGLDQLDQGLKGRGLVGNLPKPSYLGEKGGKVVIRETVDASGQVTGASYEPKGSTTDAAELIEAAKAAARKARFTESRATVQGGTITYIFRME